MLRNILGVLIAMTSTTAALGETPPPARPVSIVLVHGAFVDASGWKPVYDILVHDGYEVLVVQNPTITLDGDAAGTRQVIARASMPVVLVGHSYGGAVITAAGSDPKVRTLVYIAAFAPDIGESVFDLANRPAPGEAGPPLLPPADGFLIVDPVKFPTAFAADVDRGLTGFMAVSQVPWGLGAVQHKFAAAAWKDKPVRYMLTTQDKMIPPATQRFMATRAKAVPVELSSSRVAMLSHPKEVAAFIEAAAADAK